MNTLNRQEDLWSQISDIVNMANTDIMKRNEKIDDLARLSKLYLNRQRHIDTVDPKYFKSNKELLKPTMRRKIVLYFSDKPNDNGNWILDLLNVNKRRVTIPDLDNEKCNLNKYLLSEYLFYNLTSLNEVSRLFKRYQADFKNCEVFLIVTDKVPDSYMKYRNSIVRNVGDLIELVN